MPRKRTGSRKYGAKASQKVERAMHEYKRGQLKSGRSGRTVKSRKQAIAIGLSEAREKGAKVPSRRKSASRKSASRKSSSSRTSSSRRSGSSSSSRSGGRRQTARKKR